jgi:endonuclease-3
MESLAPKFAKRARAPKNRSAQSIREIVLSLEEVYGKARLRARFDPMEELISCILSQHTSDKSSFPTFTFFRETFPTWKDAADADPGEIVRVIKDAGLAHQKSKSILGSLRLIYERFGEYSLEPLREMSTLEARSWLLGLPGVGLKTASLVLCFSFGRETIPVDTHVFRVAKRLGLLDSTENENKAHDTLLNLVPKDFAYRFHAALIQHGRNRCRAPLPQCDGCILRERCPWVKSENVQLRGAKRSSP